MSNHAAQADSDDQNVPNIPKFLHDAASHARQPSQSGEIAATPLELFQLQLAPLSRRYLPLDKSKHLYSVLPHAVCLEILDGLPELPVFVRNAHRRHDFNFSQLLGRFANASDRKFVLVRRNLRFDVDGVYDQWIQQTLRFDFVAQPADLTSLKRNLALLFRSARYVHWELDMNSHASQMMLRDANFEQCMNLVSAVLQKPQAGRLLRSVCISTLILRSDQLVPRVLLPYVTKLIVDGLAFNEPVFDKIPNLKDLYAKTSISGCADQVPWTKLHSLKLMYFDNRDTIESILQKHLVSVNPPKITLLTVQTGFEHLFQKVHDLIVPARLLVGANVYNFSSLTRLTLAANKGEELTVVHGLNARGQLTSLFIHMPAMVPTRSYLEALGIGHPNCVLRELRITYGQNKPAGLGEPELDLLVPITQCHFLEDFVLRAHNAPFQKLQKFVDALQFMENQGLLVNFQVRE